MPRKSESMKAPGMRQRKRSRLRNFCSSKSGKSAGVVSVAAPIIGYIIHDLRKPDSIIRSLVSGTAAKLIEFRQTKPQLIDITDKINVIEEDNRSDETNKIAQ